MNSSNNEHPPWLAPVVILVVILGLVGLSRKHDEALENPLVDLALITIGVFAFAAAFRWTAGKLGSPGMATFFGQAPSPTIPIHS